MHFGSIMCSLALAVESYNGPDLGYLVVCLGDLVQVLYVGRELSDTGWLYGRLGNDTEGWPPCNICLFFLQARDPSGVVPTENYLDGIWLDVLENFSPMGFCGYLSLRKGNQVEVTYKGSTGDECGWLFGSLSDGQRGWFPESAVTPPDIVGSEEVLKRETSLGINTASTDVRAPEARPNSDTLEFGIHQRAEDLRPGVSSYIRFYPDPNEKPIEDKVIKKSRLARPGEKVQVLKYSGCWVYVRLS